MSKSAAIQSDEKELTNLTWEHDIVEARKKSEKLAWRIAGACMALAFLSVIALAVSMPLRQTVTRIVEVDKLTGETGVISSLPAYVSTRNDINDKHWIKEFTIAHERYIGKTLQLDFDKVKALGSDAVYNDFKKKFVGSNALQTKLENKVEMIPTILSTTIPSPNIATVRFEVKTTNVNNPGITPDVSRYIATIGFHYDPKPYGQEKDLVDNPLGFIVDTYQVDPEVVATSDKPQADDAASSAAPLPTERAAQNGSAAQVVPAIGGGK
jgi:type IV secretion system protein VirB8